MIIREQLLALQKLNVGRILIEFLSREDIDNVIYPLCLFLPIFLNYPH